MNWTKVSLITGLEYRLEWCMEWTMEWMIELLCTADGTIFQRTQAFFIPFPMSDVRRVSQE